MSLVQRLTEYISACFTGIWLQSHEHQDALTEMAEMCRQEKWNLAVWDVERGLQLPGRSNGQAADMAGNDPLAAIRSVNALATAESSALLVLVNFHRFLQSAEIVQALAQQIAAGKQNRTFIVVLSPVVSVPTELGKLFCVLEHDLPDRSQLEQIARGIATEDGELPAGDELVRVLDAASGLTRYEAENAYSLSLVRHHRIAPESIWELKSQTQKKSGLLSLHRGGERFAELGGLDAIKGFSLRALRQQSHPDPKASAAGRAPAGRAGHGQECLLQGPRLRNRSAHADPGYRGPYGFPRRTNGKQHSPSPEDRPPWRRRC
jgi:hypothetical protein